MPYRLSPDYEQLYNEALARQPLDVQSPEALAALLAAPVYEATVTMQARDARSGETVVIRDDEGNISHRRQTLPGDKLVNYRDQPTRVVRGSQFNLAFRPVSEQDPSGTAVYETTLLVHAGRNPAGRPISIVDSYGRTRVGDRDCVIALEVNPMDLTGQGFKNIFLIDKHDFELDFAPAGRSDWARIAEQVTNAKGIVEAGRPVRPTPSPTAGTAYRPQPERRGLGRTLRTLAVAVGGLTMRGGR